MFWWKQSSVLSGQTVTEGQKVFINTSVLDASNLFKKLPFHVDKKNYDLMLEMP